MKTASGSSDTKDSKAAPQAPSISYQLSNEVYKTLGWTSKPDIDSVVSMVTMKAKFSRPVIGPWFQKREVKMVKEYKSGASLCVAEENGTGQIYYPNGQLAIAIEKGWWHGGVTRVLVKSPGGVGWDGVTRRPQLSAIFDSLGNGVVYNYDRSKRLIYDQHHGMVWFKHGGIPVRWSWHNLSFHGSLTEEKTPIRNRKTPEKEVDVAAGSKKDPTILPQNSEPTPESDTPTPSQWGPFDDQDFTDDDNYVDTSRIHPRRALRPIIFQINRHVGLRIFSQSDIVITFFAEGHHTRLNIGVLYNPLDKLSIDRVQCPPTNEEVLCPYEVLPGRSQSLQKLKEMLMLPPTPICVF